MKPSFADKIKSLPKEVWSSERLTIRPIENNDDLWYAVVECSLAPGQEEYVNPAGFSIGRAYLAPGDNVPCVICKRDGEKIGYIALRTWIVKDGGFSWSYYLDRRFQGLGYGKEAARLAVAILKAVDPQMPVKLSTEVDNIKAQRLYTSIGFVKSEEMDGDDLVFVL
ncbi:MAG: GNAT family N-acetyltransferase [Oscillospiraceae bacterium]|nr:GNAT family N-acetyltransferase [Oscillospiraceae bacterium]